MGKHARTILKEKISEVIDGKTQYITGAKLTTTQVVSDIIDLAKINPQLTIEQVWEVESYFYANFGMHSYDYRHFKDFMHDPSVPRAVYRALSTSKETYGAIEPFSVQKLLQSFKHQRIVKHTGNYLVKNTQTDTLIMVATYYMYCSGQRFATIDNKISFTF